MIELNNSGATILPSVVAIANGEVYVGEEAIEIGRQFPDFMFRNFKRRIGEKWHEDEDTGHQTCNGPGDLLHYRGPEGVVYSPVELYSYVLHALLQRANEYLAPQESVTGAVLCVPADFTPAQVQGVEEAARLAGLTQFHTLEEPVAAGLANNVDAKKARLYPVVDLGGGTLDLSILKVGSGLIQVFAKTGIRDLGGVDWDDRLRSYAANLFRTEHGIDLTARDAPMIRLGVEAEAVKRRLSDKSETVFRVDDIDRTKDGVTLHSNFKIDQRTFDELTVDLRDRILGACKALLARAKDKDVNFSLKDLQPPLFVGGMMRCPGVRDAVSDFFGKAPRKEGVPEEVVALGAAIKAAIIEGRRPDVTVSNVTNHAYGIETVNNIPAILIPRNRSYPFEERITLSNPDDMQSEISVRWIIADKTRATDCEVIWSADIPIEPVEAEAARIPMLVKMDEQGRISVQCLEHQYEGAA
jgi:molecular chaperone DnaK